MSEGELVVVAQREVDFYGDALAAVRGDDGQVYVALAQVCDALGIDTGGQRRRLQEHDILRDGLAQATIDTAGGRQRAWLVRADLVPLWLASLRAGAVRAELVEKLRLLQRRAAVVLWEAFRDGELTAAGDDELAGVSAETAQAVELARAVLALARNQAAMEARLGGRLAAVEGRLETVEAALGDKSRLITEEQATALSQAVKAVALALGKASGRNEFGQVWSNLYRRFGVAAYRQLPARRFDEAMKWLDQWYQEATPGPDSLPF